MKTLLNILDVRTSVGAGELKPTAILLLSAFLPTVHRYFGSIEFAVRSFSVLSASEAVLFMFTSAFFLLGLIPFFVVVRLFREPLKEYGLTPGNWKEGILLTAVLIPLIALTMLYPASQTEEMRTFYPFDKSIGSSLTIFLQYEFLRGLFFYTAWEFFFRGFMLFGLRKYVGDWLAICIQTIPSCLWHIGMPTGEILSSIAGGVLFGLMAIRTRSILWPFILHWAIGIGLDAFIILTS